MSKPKALLEQIEEVRALCSAFVDDKVAELAKQTPGIPSGVLRQMIVARAGVCECRQAIRATEGNI
jgi:hypothetical protein